MPLYFQPPLLNSATPWATTKDDLQRLYDCAYTGAVTVRTSMLHGFPHDPSIHQYTFFDTNAGCVKHSPNGSKDLDTATNTSSLNTLGYSPIKLHEYLDYITEIVHSEGHDKEDTGNAAAAIHKQQKKPFIVSVTGTAEEVGKCLELVSTCAQERRLHFLVEINLSCPNIFGKPPPAYEGSSLASYLAVIQQTIASLESKQCPPVLIGIKVPPYTYQGQFDILINTLLDSANASSSGCPVSFITSTNTLGSSLVLDLPVANTDDKPPLPALPSAAGTGIGGMAGTALHPLALGNVRTIRSMLDQHPSLSGIEIIGVGGVSDAAGFKRMKSVGASVVAVGTALGRFGVQVYQNIVEGLA
ncbi:FMN-linked oxidoreductase [Xylona heveae TC161]|uniref:Dihydroorotate dehydrogenase (fumarate) n=1 Tax=Xylona heveae (strain CBS 132557 / TC161) TaxID=1328760 RepID=A0A165JPK5_XYLHT|nr:FMN-linked oxidoreductase [Xylona heveae TC161]KZF26486.1 FMN-linked oxidoreductase [Xylona heveae TC161]